MTIILKCGAVYHLLFAVFHIFWPTLFKWDKALAPLDTINKQLLPIMSGLFIYIYLVIALISMFSGPDFLSTPYGKWFLLSVAVFWLIRSGMQIRYFGLKQKEALVFFLIFITGIGLYSVPLAMI